MNLKMTSATLITSVFVLLLLIADSCNNPAFAQATGNNNSLQNPILQSTLDSNQGNSGNIRLNYMRRFPVAQEFGPSTVGGADVIQNMQSMGPGVVQHNVSGPVYTWPITVPTATSAVPTLRDQAIQKDLFQTFGLPVSDTQFQLIQRYNDNRMLEQMFDPEKLMWLASSTAGLQSTSAANGAANMATNQAQSAIDFTKAYLVNFTAEAGNRWQLIRDQLFIPMAILLFLPGAVLAQVRALVAQGSPVFGEVNPFEGIIRSLVAIFLIPGTFLVINYGIDVSNSITFTIASEYRRLFGTDMYQDAICAEIRAFGGNTNNPQNNLNALPATNTPTQNQAQTQPGQTVWNPYEALTLAVRKYDPCAGIDQQLTPDEQASWQQQITRLTTNMSNTGLTAAWNVMCAFQMAFLYYLWCMGPIAAALWVWPMQRMRSALPSWIEGVITLCFWSLFWNTVVLLMAAFRGVGDTGTVIMSALNWLANYCVKYAFDFSGLVSDGAAAAVQQAMQGAQGGGPGGTGGMQVAPGNNASAGGGNGALAARTPNTTNATRTAQTPGVRPNLASLNQSVQQATNTPLLNALGNGGPKNGNGFPSNGGLPLNTQPLTFALPHGTNPLPSGAPYDPGLPPNLNPLSAFDSKIPGLSNSLQPNSALIQQALQSGANAANSHGLGLRMDQNGNLAMNHQAMAKMQQEMLQQQHQANVQQALQQALHSAEQGDQSQLNQWLNDATNAGALDAQTQSAVASMLHNGVVPSSGPNGLQIDANTAKELALSGGMPLTHLPANLVSGVSPVPLADTNLPPTDINTQMAGLQQLANQEHIGNFHLQNAQGQTVDLSNIPPGEVLKAVGDNGQVFAQLDPSSHQWSAASTNGTVTLGQNGQWLADGVPVSSNGQGQWSETGTSFAYNPNAQSFTVDGQQLSASSLAAQIAAQEGLHGQQLPASIVASQMATQQSLHQLANQEGITSGFHFVDASGHMFTDLSQVPPGDQLRAVADGASAPFASMNASGQWAAEGTNGSIVLGANGQWLADGVPVTSNGQGQWFQAGTNFAYDTATHSFAVDGQQLPASIVASQMATQESLHQQANLDVNGNMVTDLSQLPPNNQLHAAVDGTTTPLAPLNTSGQWPAEGTNGSVVLGANGQWLADGVPVTTNGQGQWFEAGTNSAYNPATHSFAVDGQQVSATTIASQYATQESLYQLAQQEGITGGVHFVDASNGQAYASLSQVPPSSQIQAIADGATAPFASMNASGQWAAEGTNGSVVLGANGQWLADNVPVTTSGEGQWNAAGTNFAYDPSTQSFTVDGSQFPAAAVSAPLLQAAYMHVPAADTTLRALEQPGVLTNLAAAVDGNPQAFQSVVDATHVNPIELYHAAQGDPLAAMAVMAQGAAYNPEYGRYAANEMNVSADTLRQAANDPLVAAQIVGQQAHASQFYASYVADQLHLPAQTIMEAAYNQHSAAQLVEASYAAQYSSTPSYSQTAAAHDYSNIASSTSVSPSDVNYSADYSTQQQLAYSLNSSQVVNHDNDYNINSSVNSTAGPSPINYSPDYNTQLAYSANSSQVVNHGNEYVNGSVNDTTGPSTINYSPDYNTQQLAYTTTTPPQVNHDNDYNFNSSVNNAAGPAVINYSPDYNTQQPAYSTTPPQVVNHDNDYNFNSSVNNASGPAVINYSPDYNRQQSAYSTTQPQVNQEADYSSATGSTTPSNTQLYAQSYNDVTPTSVEQGVITVGTSGGYWGEPLPTPTQESITHHSEQAISNYTGDTIPVEGGGTFGTVDVSSAPTTTDINYSHDDQTVGTVVPSDRTDDQRRQVVQQPQLARAATDFTRVTIPPVVVPAMLRHNTRPSGPVPSSHALVDHEPKTLAVTNQEEHAANPMDLTVSQRGGRQLSNKDQDELLRAQWEEYERLQEEKRIANLRLADDSATNPL